MPTVKRYKRAALTSLAAASARPSKWILTYLLTGELPADSDKAEQAEADYLLLAGNNSLGLPEKANCITPKRLGFTWNIPT